MRKLKVFVFELSCGSFFSDVFVQAVIAKFGNGVMDELALQKYLISSDNSVWNPEKVGLKLAGLLVCHKQSWKGASHSQHGSKAVGLFYQFFAQHVFIR